MTTKDTPIGARRAVQRVVRAGPIPASEREPLSEFPAQLQEWNGRVWVHVSEAHTPEEVEAFLATGVDW